MDNIEKHLKKVDLLPPSPALLPKLLPKLSDVDANFDEVVEIIALDPALTSKLLQICNSAYFGHQSQVTSVAEAVNEIGYQAIYLLASIITGSASFPTRPGVDGNKLWRHSITTAFNSMFVAESASLDGNLLFTAGLLHDLGKVILAQEQPSISFFQGPSGAEELAREKTIFGCNHAEVGAALLEIWKLPDSISSAVRFHHDPPHAQYHGRLAACITLGDLLAHSPERPQALACSEFQDTLNQLNLSADLVPRWQERLRDHRGLLGGVSRLPL